MLTSIDHFVLTAKDMDKTISFYCDVLGMTLEEFTPSDGGEARKSLKFGNQKINLHRAESPYKPHANNPVSGAVDICFLSSAKMEEWQSIFAENNIKIEDGPVQKTGATGPIISLYIRDPDLNLIEISNKL
ncbi:MAG: VOC family protein [Alphaproteobacteria bacterium]|nr:VOC family protein [Alphaproteobacteria bacterium]